MSGTAIACVSLPNALPDIPKRQSGGRARDAGLLCLHSECGLAKTLEWAPFFGRRSHNTQKRRRGHTPLRTQPHMPHYTCHSQVLALVVEVGCGLELVLLS